MSWIALLLLVALASCGGGDLETRAVDGRAETTPDTAGLRDAVGSDVGGDALPDLDGGEGTSSDLRDLGPHEATWDDMFAEPETADCGEGADTDGCTGDGGAPDGGPDACSVAERYEVHVVFRVPEQFPAADLLFGLRDALVATFEPFYIIACLTGEPCTAFFPGGESGPPTPLGQRAFEIMASHTPDVLALLCGHRAVDFFRWIRLNAAWDFGKAQDLPVEVASEALGWVPSALEVGIAAEAEEPCALGDCSWQEVLHDFAEVPLTLGASGPFRIDLPEDGIAPLSTGTVVLSVDWTALTILIWERAALPMYRRDLLMTSFEDLIPHLLGGRDCTGVEECCAAFVSDLAPASYGADPAEVLSACEAMCSKGGDALRAAFVPQELLFAYELNASNEDSCGLRDDDQDSILDTVGSTDGPGEPCSLSGTVTFRGDISAVSPGFNGERIPAP